MSFKAVFIFFSRMLSKLHIKLWTQWVFDPIVIIIRPPVFWFKMLIILFCVFCAMVNFAHLHTERGDCISSSGKSGRCSEPLIGCARQYISVGGECPSKLPVQLWLFNRYTEVIFSCCGTRSWLLRLSSKDERDQRTEKRQLYPYSQFTENILPAESFQLAQSAEPAGDVQIAQGVKLTWYCSRSEFPKGWTKSVTETAFVFYGWFSCLTIRIANSWYL